MIFGFQKLRPPLNFLYSSLPIQSKIWNCYLFWCMIQQALFTNKRFDSAPYICLASYWIKIVNQHFRILFLYVKKCCSSRVIRCVWRCIDVEWSSKLINNIEQKCIIYYNLNVHIIDSSFGSCQKLFCWKSFKVEIFFRWNTWNHSK